MAERTQFQPIAIKKESTKGTAVTPDVYVPMYSESMTTNLNLNSDEPAFGRRLKRYQSLKGQRAHTGSIKIMAEANSAARFLDMVATRTGTSGSDPYTHTYGESITTDPNSYTVDVPKGVYAVRFMGVEASTLTISFNDNKMEFELDLSALKSFYPREVSSVSGSGPYTCVLKTDYDPTPTDGLVVGDNIKFYDVSANSYIDAVVDSIVDATSFTVSENIAAIGSGDMIGLAVATPSLSILPNFLWSKTQFFFASSASTAQTNSSTASNQTRLEPGTQIVLMNEFEDNEGSKRSGSADPASLIRAGGYDVTFNPKIFLDTPDKIREWASTAKRSVVMRSYSGATNQHELRMTLNNMKALTNDTPSEAGQVIYHEFEYAIDYDTSDTQAFDFKAINGLSTI